MEIFDSNSQEREMHQLQQMQDKAKEKCMESFRLVHSHLKVLSIKGGFERACVALFDQDNQTFTESLLLNLDNLEKQLDREEFQETESIGAFRTIDERAQHKRENNRRVNDRVMQSKEGKVDSSTALDAGLVVTKSNETESERHVSSSRSGKDTHAEDAEVHFAIPEKERIRSLFADKSDISETKAPLSKKRRVYTLQCALSSKREISWKGPNWLFDLDYLTDSKNYQHVRSENQANKHAGPKEANHSAGTQDNINAGNSEIEAESAQDYFVLPIWSSYTSTVKSSEAKNKGEKPTKNTDLKTNEKPVDQEDQAFLDELERAARASSTNTVNTVSTQVSTVSSALVLPGLKLMFINAAVFG
ncbi:hypothetical protein Tco_0749318 [Tanacetum coccineum]|uniref:Uncharacterized protein n=1 Tax=Tanacetum coccineum TaxID=301880 RepID=A0ABQ4Z0U8_9ASTR